MHLFVKKVGYTVLSGKETEAQLFIDNFEDLVPTLSPRQFQYLLALTGLDLAMDKVLEQLRTIDIETYAQCKSQLSGASYFEWDKSKVLYTQLKPMIVALNPELDFTVEDLKLKWLLCYEN